MNFSKKKSISPEIEEGQISWGNKKVKMPAIYFIIIIIILIAGFFLLTSDFNCGILYHKSILSTEAEKH